MMLYSNVSLLILILPINLSCCVVDIFQPKTPQFLRRLCVAQKLLELEICLACWGTRPPSASFSAKIFEGGCYYERFCYQGEGPRAPGSGLFQ